MIQRTLITRPILLAVALTALLTVPAGAQESALDRPVIAGDDLDDLMVALDREYRLWTVYDRAIEELGGGEPFVTARRVQERRLRQLIALYAAHGLAVPANPWDDGPARFDDRSAACLAGFRAELAIDRLYGELGDRAGEEALAATYRAATATPALEALRDCALEGEI